MSEGTRTSRRTMLLRTLLVLLFAWGIAVGNTALAYVTLGYDAVPIAVGVVLSLAFVIVLRLLHQAWWLALLSAVPALLVLVGSVQYAPEAALERRGVRESVLVFAHEGSGNDHSYTLVGPEGRLDEPLEYRGSNPGYRIGQRIEIVRDPEGEVPLADAADVDARGRRAGLVIGVTAWTLMVPLAGWRGYVQRRKNREPLLERLGVM
ncbi:MULTISPECIES: hypothetical protein [Streptomyces]|uniref:DUF3592 domain-containing protein n=2 Tax=Streptomyces TaxID=1883 RepID=A0A100Y5H5_9ACTN|nr:MULTISPECIES: hypothetical protein [Streptomyces]KUH38067.1 hypothetical protein ATE80_14485 [Streptomyces kanasensis]UUS33052.1 hypothetical protein NRO40_21010 [Streptomyces changanensis]